MIFKYRMKYTFIAILFVALFLSGCSNAEENKVYGDEVLDAADIVAC